MWRGLPPWLAHLCKPASREGEKGPGVKKPRRSRERSGGAGTEKRPIRKRRLTGESSYVNLFFRKFGKRLGSFSFGYGAFVHWTVGGSLDRGRREGSMAAGCGLRGVLSEGSTCP